MVQKSSPVADASLCSAGHSVAPHMWDGDPTWTARGHCSVRRSGLRGVGGALGFELASGDSKPHAFLSGPQRWGPWRSGEEDQVGQALSPRSQRAGQAKLPGDLGSTSFLHTALPALSSRGPEPCSPQAAPGTPGEGHASPGDRCAGPFHLPNQPSLDSGAFVPKSTEWLTARGFAPPGSFRQ